MPIAALALALAFVKINDRPFIYFFLAAILYFIKPKLYIFNVVPELTAPLKAVPEKPSEISAPKIEEKVTISKLKELALSLDTRK